MSCELQLTATLEGINKFLDEEKSEGYNKDASRKTLQSFKIAFSPTGEILVFGKSTWLLICVSKWDSSVTDNVKIKYTPNWHGHVNCKPGEEITSIFCWPFFSQGQSSLGCADWTCLVLGFSSGCIKFYTEEMQELACSILHEERITDIKCFYAMPTHQGKHQKQDSTDIYVVYKTVICIFNKTQLSLILQNKRNELAKGYSIKKNETESYLTFDFKKYSFVGQEEVVDACFLGQTLVSSFNTFDHLVTASLVGGFNSHYRASPPQTSLIVTSGRRPFVGFHYTLEGGSSAVLTDVALAVASKIKNSVTATLPDWFSFGSKKSSSAEKPKEVSQEFAEKLNCRFGLCDLWRHGHSVIVSPDSTFSAVTDSLGRVTLIDNVSGIAHQLWKGYRDAQCGFLQVQEDVKKLGKTRSTFVTKSQPRQGLFIVIYAPKKGLIEIFSIQHGRRVASFKVTKYGHLLYSPKPRNGCSVLAGGFNVTQSQVLFLSEEGFSEFSIPFHCALAEDSSRISRDLHVLKKLKALLKIESSSGNAKSLEEIEKCAMDLKTDDVRLQAIESMITYKNVSFEAFKIVLNVFKDSLKDKERTEPAPQKIILFTKTLLDLLLFYEFLNNREDSKSKVNKAEDTVGSFSSLSEELRLPQNELDILLKVIQQITEIEKNQQQSSKVVFEEKSSTKLVQFLSNFDFENFLNILDKNDKVEECKESIPYILNLKSKGKENNLSYLGEVFFKGIFIYPFLFDQWKSFVHKIGLNSEDLVLCLISYWCNKKINDNIFSEIKLFVEVLKAVCSLNDPDIVAVEYNVESPWWKEIRSFIAGNPFTIRGLLAALCCRSVTIFMEQEREFSLKGNCEKKITDKEKENSSANETSAFINDWEAISKDSCQWDILIMQLQDVALLNAVLKLTFKTSNHLPVIPFDFEPQCLSSIQASGRGRISELVARWLIQFGFESSSLIDKNDLEFQTSNENNELEKEKVNLIFAIDKANDLKKRDESSDSILEYLALLKSRFPYSLTSSLLLGNMCWEYFAYWFKNIDDVQYLETAVRYLVAIPGLRIKYGISFLSWTTFLEQKFETLAKMINRIGKVPKKELCVQEIGLRNDQVPIFFKLICEVLKIMLHTDIEDKPDFGVNKESVWQNSSTSNVSCLIFIAVSQPIVNSDLILYQLQLSYSLLIMSSLNIKHLKVFTSLFDNVERSSFMQSGTQLSSHHQNLKLKDSRTEFLKKCLSAAVQTIEVVEYIPPASSDGLSNVAPTTMPKVESYKKWLQMCFELAGMWAVPLEDLRKHQICELYSNCYDRLAEEVLPSVNDTSVLASQLLVLGGKRLKYLIQDSNDLFKELTKLSANLSEWLHTLDIEDFSYYGTPDDIEVLMRYIIKSLPEGHFDQKLAVAVIESLSFLRTKTT